MAVKTIVIIEHAHCGTTMLAGMLEIAGVPMVGDNYKKMKWEDQEIIQAMRSGNEEEFGRVVRKRNQEHDVWGFKSPGAWQHMPLLVKYLRNPIFLAIYKDPVTVTVRRRRRGGPFINLVLDTADQYAESLLAMRNTRQPIHLFSYLKAIITPGLFVQELLDVAGIEADKELVDRLMAFIQPNKGGPRKPYPSVKKWTSAS